MDMVTGEAVSSIFISLLGPACMALAIWELTIMIAQDAPPLARCIGEYDGPFSVRITIHTIINSVIGKVC